MISAGLIHVAAAVIAMFAGAVLFGSRKGTKRHRRLGYLYLGAMVNLNVAAWTVDGFYADVPDLRLVCDGLRIAGDHVAYLWTFTGTHVATGNSLRVVGWEEWNVGPDLLVRSSLGWFDADDYARQVAGG